MKSTLKSFCLKKYRRGGEGLGALSPESMASADVHYKPETYSRSLPASATRLFSKKLEYLKEDGIGRCLSLHYTLNETTMARCTSPIYL